MRKQKRITLVIALAVVIAGLGFYLWQSREPSFEGRSLSEWLWDGGQKGAVEESGAKEAVRQMGSKAIPTLLGKLRRKNSPISLKLMDLSRRLGVPHYVFAPEEAQEENGLAARGFEWLGSEASGAAPELIGIYHQNISETSQNCALKSLLFAAPAQSRALLNEALTNGFEEVRVTALWQLTPTNQPEVAVPLLINCLSDPSSRIQSMAAMKLRQFGTNALPAVPALLRLASSAPSNNRGTFTSWFTANRTLCLVDPQTAAKVLTNGPWTYEKYTNDLALAKARNQAKNNSRRRLAPPVQNDK